MMTKFGKISLISASFLVILVCTGCNDTMRETLVSGIANSLSDIVSSIISNAAEGVLGI